MHELAIADSIVAIASEHASGRRVTSVQVRIGHLRQVVPSALEFGFELCAHGTPVEGARLDIEAVPATGECRSCGAVTELTCFPFRCAACGHLDLEVTGGEELLVDSLEVEEDEALVR